MTQTSPTDFRDHPDESVVLSVIGFGPINRAEDIAMRPLTIFAGPGSSGKSYLASLWYGVMTALRSSSINAANQELPLPTTGVSREQFQQWVRAVAREEGPRDVIPPVVRSVERAAARHILERFPIDLHLQLSLLHGRDLGDLVNWHSDDESFYLRIQDPSGRWEGSLRYRKSTDSFDLHLENVEEVAQYRPPVGPRRRDPLTTVSPIGFSRSFRSGRDDVQNVRWELDANDAGFAISRVVRFSDWMAHPSFLPATRAGLIQGQQLLASQAITRAVMAGIEPLNIQPFSKTVGDFLTSWMTLRDNPREFSRRPVTQFGALADQAAHDLMHGDVLLPDPDQRKPYFTYRARPNDNPTLAEIPLDKASSSINELAPLVLLLRYSLHPGDTLIFEEPEAHLHPQAQRGLAKVLVSAVNSGLRVLITTHSPYILEQITNCALYHRLSEANPSTASEANPDMVQIDPNMIGFYSFIPTSSGVVVETKVFDYDNGYYPDDFTEVDFDVHNEMVTIVNGLGPIYDR